MANKIQIMTFEEFYQYLRKDDALFAELLRIDPLTRGALISFVKDHGEKFQGKILDITDKREDNDIDVIVRILRKKEKDNRKKMATATVYARGILEWINKHCGESSETGIREHYPDHPWGSDYQ